MDFKADRENFEKLPDLDCVLFSGGKKEGVIFWKHIYAVFLGIYRFLKHCTAKDYFCICMLTMIQDRNLKMSKVERSMKLLNRANKYVSACYDILLTISPNSVKTRAKSPD